MELPFKLRPEPPAVYAVLVGHLFTTFVPSAIMGATIVAVASFIGWTTGGAAAWIAAMIGLAGAVAKLWILAAWQRNPPPDGAPMPEVQRWERRSAACTLAVSVGVGMLGAHSFQSGSLPAQLIATALLFAYCSGHVARTAIRPLICITASSIAAIPVLISTAAVGESAYLVVAAMFAIFLIGSFESVLHIYRAATQQITQGLELATVARHDPLTGLPNRFRLREAFPLLPRTGQLAVHCFDLDRFKPVNDRYGHPTGDALLRELARRLEAVLPPGGIAARLGGDEFVVIQPGIGHLDEAEMFARRLSRAITAPYLIAGQQLEIGVSIGCATAPPLEHALDVLIAAADAALYRIKQNGGGISRPRPVSVATAIG